MAGDLEPIGRQFRAPGVNGGMLSIDHPRGGAMAFKVWDLPHDQPFLLLSESQTGILMRWMEEGRDG